MNNLDWTDYVLVTLCVVGILLNVAKLAITLYHIG